MEINRMSLNVIWKPQDNLNISHSDQMQLWCQSVEGLASYLEFFNTLLSEDEKQKAGSFVFFSDKQRYIISRGFLRYLLGHYLKISPGSVKFAYNDFGKPELIGASNLHFNLSHSGNFLLIGINKKTPIGVDLEHERENINIKEIAYKYFTEAEYKKLNTMPEIEQKSVFYTTWTRKEAIIKALGKGLSHSLNQVVIDASNKCLIEDKVFTVLSFPTATSYYAAMTCLGDVNREQIEYCNFIGKIDIA